MVVTQSNFSRISLRMIHSSACHKFKNVDDPTGDENVAGQVVIVTGASAGIGKEVALALAKRDAIVVLACRDLEKTQKVINDIKKEAPQSQLHMVQLDLADLDSVRKCAQEICEKFPKIKVLINNAGYMGIHSAEWTSAGFEKHLVTNHLGPFLFTLLLLKPLANSGASRIVNVGATAFEVAELNLDDLNLKKPDVNLGYMNLGAYANSKMCNYFVTKLLADRLAGAAAGTGIRTYWLCPGIVSTGLTSSWPGFLGAVSRLSARTFGISGKQGAETVMYCALSTEVSQESGKPYHFRGHWPEAEKLYDAQKAEKVWQMSEEFVDLKFSTAFP